MFVKICVSAFDCNLNCNLQKIYVKSFMLRQQESAAICRVQDCKCNDEIITAEIANVRFIVATKQKT